MHSVLISFVTPASENIRGTSALPYHLIKGSLTLALSPEGEGNIEFILYTFNNNGLTDEKIAEVEEELGVTFKKVPVPRWYRWMFKLHLLFLRVFLRYPIANYIKLPKRYVDEINDQKPDMIWVMGDDGSKDASGVICDEYANKYDNIQTIHQENSGVTMARKKGIQVANGTWISFVDADDTPPHDAIQNLAQSISDETDIIMGNINEDTAKNVIDLEQCRHCMVKGKYLHPGIWGKLIRKSLFNDYVTDIPREIFKGEDQLMNIRLLFETTKIPAFVKKNVYNYRRNTVSVSHTRKASVEYEAFYDKYRVSSIPVSELNKYMHEIISIRLNGLIGCALSDPATLCKKDYPYLQIIKNDISEYHYNLNTIEHLLLSFRFPWLYRILASFIMVKNSLKYRLRL